MNDKETMRRVAEHFGYTNAEFEVMWLTGIGSICTNWNTLEMGRSSM